MEMIKFIPTCTDLEDYGVYRVPQDIYQIMADCIDPRINLEANQNRIKKILLDWLEYAHPDKVLESFEELKTEEATLLHSRFPNLTFGFYVKLLNKQNHEETNLITSNSSNSNSKQLH